MIAQATTIAASARAVDVRVFILLFLCYLDVFSSVKAIGRRAGGAYVAIYPSSVALVRSVSCGNAAGHVMCQVF